MFHSKKQRIFLILAVCILLFSAGAFFSVKHYLDSRITFPINDTLPDGGGQKATVIILAGQSNASGSSCDSYLQNNVSEEKYNEYTAGYDNVYINYLTGIKKSDGFVKCTTLQGEADGLFGPELGMAEKLHELYPNETFFIIKCARGGSNLCEQWLSPSSSGRTGELYRMFVAFVKTSLQYLDSKNYNIQLAGICWMQGESDAYPLEAAETYGENLHNFVEDVRDEFSQYAADAGIAFVDAYIAANPMCWVYYEQINQAKLAFSQTSPMNALVDTIAHGLDSSQEPIDFPDIPHYDSLSMIKLGHLFAEELVQFLDAIQSTSA